MPRLQASKGNRRNKRKGRATARRTELDAARIHGRLDALVGNAPPARSIAPQFRNAEIRRRYERGEDRIDLAREFGLPADYVRRLVLGQLSTAERRELRNTDPPPKGE